MAKPTTKKIACRVRAFDKDHTFPPYVAGDEVEINESDLRQPAIRAALITLDEEREEQAAKAEAETTKRKEQSARLEEARTQAMEAQKLAKARRASAVE